MAKKRTARNGDKLVSAYLWLKENDHKRSKSRGKKTKPKISQHAVLVNSVTIGLDEMERLEKKGKK